MKMCKIFSSPKLRVYFSRNSSFADEFIGYVDLSDFYQICVMIKDLLDDGAIFHCSIFDFALL